MRHLRKLPEPDVLARLKAQWKAEYDAAKAANDVDAKAKIVENYRHPEIKATLVNETLNKCVYCESSVDHVDHLEVEHIQPRSKHEDLIFEWDNLTLACHLCNTSKNDRYDDTAGILNPYCTDPANHLQPLGPLIIPKPGDDVGEVARFVFDLDRAGLIEKRTTKIMAVRELVDAHARRTSALQKDLIVRQIRRELADNQEYTFVTRAVVKQLIKGFRLQ